MTTTRPDSGFRNTMRYIQNLPMLAEEFRYEKKHFMDKLMDKAIRHGIPEDSPDRHVLEQRMHDPMKKKQPLSISVLASNFKKLSKKMGTYFEVQYGLIHVLTWKQPSKTLSFLVMYTIVCLWPHVVLLFPLLFLLCGVMIPGYLHRHPMSHRNKLIKVKKRGQSLWSYFNGNYENSIVQDYLEEHQMVEEETMSMSSTSSEASEFLAKVEEEPVVDDTKREKGKHVKSQVALLINMRDLQNLTLDILDAIDQAERFWFETAGFKDEKLSTLLFFGVIAAIWVVLFLGRYIPWRALFIQTGWAALILAHPHTKTFLQLLNKSGPKQETVSKHVEKKVKQEAKLVERDDIIVDDKPEIRTVEVFELQSRSALHTEWKFYLYSNEIFDMKDPVRLAGKIPPGVNHLSKIVPLRDWKFDLMFANKWQVDENPAHFLRERGLDKTDVFAVVDGDPWVYDGAKPTDDFALEFRRRRLYRVAYRYARSVKTPKII